MISQSNSEPIFIHSLFRSGSTYIFNCFRRSNNGYWCYQEPLNEILLGSFSSDLLLAHDKALATYLRHPKLDQPYFYEYVQLSEFIVKHYQVEFAYQDYFTKDPSRLNALCVYLNGLYEGAKGRAVFQECRSAGRVEAIKSCLGGKHIYLWRNSWDQWWSYKVDKYFDLCNIKIIMTSNIPTIFKEIKNLLCLDNFTSSNIETASHHPLSSENSYLLYFTLWCHAMLEAMPLCDIDINIDLLSTDTEYRKATLEKFELNNIQGIEFDDCSIPIGLYGSKDREFFKRIEDQVYALFLKHGYSEEGLNYILTLKNQCSPHICLKEADIRFANAFSQLREMLRTQETEIGLLETKTYMLQNDLNNNINKLSDKDQQLAEKDQQLTEKDQQLTEKDRQLAEKDQQLNNNNLEIKSQYQLLEDTRKELLNIQNSWFWRLRKFWSK